MWSGLWDKFNTLESVETLSVFPNPTSDFVTIKANVNKEDVYNIRINNVIGEIVFKDAAVYIKDEYQKIIDLSHYPKGIYILQIENKKGTLNKKVMLE